MNFSPQARPTGLCKICGKPTRLLIHVQCGITADKNNENKPKAKRRLKPKKSLPAWMFN